MDAEAALEAIVAGDMDALEWLYRELRVPVFAVALAITADRGLAEDVLQETFLRVYTYARSYQPGSRPRAWVAAIARNLLHALVGLTHAEIARALRLPAGHGAVAVQGRPGAPGDDPGGRWAWLSGRS